MKFCSMLLAVILCLGTAACGGNPKSSSGGVASGSGPVEFLPSSSLQEALPPPAESPAAVGDSSIGSVKAPEEVRSIWISYLELGTLLTGKSEAEYRTNMAEAFDNCVDFGLNTVVLQVRPFGDAIYPSRYFPQSYLFTGTEGAVGAAPFDALAIAVEEAHKRALQIEAWINPYRVRSAGGKPLHPTNPALKLLESGGAVKMGELISYNPDNAKEAQALIVNGVIEIVENYAVDGIHFDDYFYPTTDPAFDSGDYLAYQGFGGKKDLAGFRRENVTQLMQQVHGAIQKTKPEVLFGISPQGNMENNLNKQYVDVAEIVKKGYIDYLCPQMYFGFANSSCPYQATVEFFDALCRDTDVQLYVGLCTYKFGKPDTWAGAGKDEWIGTTDILSRQVSAARKLQEYGGFALYRYDSTMNPAGYFAEDSVIKTQAVTEMGNLQALLSK